LEIHRWCFIFYIKKIFRINNIKLYKLIGKKTNYENKIVSPIKNIKIKLNNIYPNIHFKFNVFPKKIKLEKWRRRRRLIFPGPNGQKGDAYVSLICDLMSMTIWRSCS
jgi:hypothetical protein